jgi:hypothetical protein
MTIGRNDIGRKNLGPDAGFRRRGAAWRHSASAKRKMVNIWQGLARRVEEKPDFNRP